MKKVTQQVWARTKSLSLLIISALKSTMTWFIGLLKILLNGLSQVSWFQIRRNIGETFVYVGNKISGRHRYMEPIIDLVINDENKEEFLYKVSLVTRRYDIEIGIYETYEEAGQVCDNIEATIKELQ